MMQWLTVSFAIGALFLVSFDSHAGDAKSPKKSAGIFGEIVNAIPAKDGGKTGTITIHGFAKAGKKGEAKPTAKDFVIKVDATTKIEKLTGKKKDDKNDPATFGDLQVGRKVLAQARPGVPDVAERIFILPMKKK